ncbi:4-diphosphocytidyl-2-C-methyl-D-erythritol kinase [Desulfotomaculum nigrificans CO-1-SRB]|uniref:4-diphosphocytidyl-2-C-methyl-D-erythritol kinase n=1 Tax=Desulfotomaculum nigrificans (strain DSM 14880 / VKM B-2319 / CO-1-SRB) TaxID=868595 RepID=F6B4G3_DESCC|nr:4-(cytidine 5'-diphospho)-2-C-methyl-D-erythritol kinase [Desulfotomaculum nigrificans]AEF92986.1 4-diphosphocytidyl-2-C-methyl-D-erythritol kinase [Desulfotomaculum nigrificans CO-1-SRB]
MGLSLTAHAKINLTLDVLSRRPDGYHEVEMIMQSIKLHDRLEFSPAVGEITLTSTGLPVPMGPDNLILRAARLLQQRAGVNHGAHIHLDKRIPVAAGLAGGSTDAAATLQGLNRLWQLELKQDQLMELARQLGADVSFCLTGGTAIARGIGEVLTPLAPAPRFGVILVKPPFGVSTARVYQGLDLNNLGHRPHTSAMVEALKQGDLDKVAYCLANVLESVTLNLYPELKEIKQQLMQAGCRGVLMSGSGPTVFGLTKDEKSAEQIAGKLNYPGYQVIATSMV